MALYRATLLENRCSRCNEPIDYYEPSGLCAKCARQVQIHGGLLKILLLFGGVALFLAVAVMAGK